MLIRINYENLRKIRRNFVSIGKSLFLSANKFYVFLGLFFDNDLRFHK